LHHFRFEYPALFFLLGAIVCFYKCPRKAKPAYFPHLHYFSEFARWINREKLLYSLIFSLGVCALASPISYDAKLASHRKGRDLVFVIDTSGSMAQSGFSQEYPSASKFSLLVDIIKEFIAKRYDDNVGVSVFGSYAFASIPLTYDMKSVRFLLDFLDVGIAGENTAIGDGIERAVELLKKGKAKNKVIILITDGYQNSGHTSVKNAVAKAKKAGIKIYTIGIGTQADFDAKLLKRIAKESGAMMFEAADAQLLQNVFAELDKLEPSAIRSQNYLNKHMLFVYPLSAMFLLLMYLLLKKRESFATA